MAKEQINTGIAHNMLTHGTKIVGTLSTDRDVRIDGIIEGDVTCNGKIVVGTTGNVKGNVQCINAEIMGVVEGKVVVNELLSLRATSQISGEIKTKTLTIEPNAIFNGTCEMAKKADGKA